MVGPEVVAQAVEEIGKGFIGERVRQGETLEGGPLFDQSREAANAAVRMVCGTLAMGFPARCVAW